MKLDKQRIEACRPVATFLRKLSHKYFVLHGSKHRFDVAEPRQAKSELKWEHQNECAVYGSICVEYALIHALIREPSYRFNDEHDHIVVHDQKIVVRRGFIYVFPTAPFKPVDDGAGGIWRLAYEPVPVIARVEVGPEMLAHFPMISFQCCSLRKRVR